MAFARTSRSQAKDHAVAVRLCLEQLADPKRACLKDPSELAAIGFKAVHAQNVTGVQRVDERVLKAMEAYADVAPAHNPPYIAAMRLLSRELPEIPLVAAFETGFHETIPAASKHYAVPMEWVEKYGVKRLGLPQARAIATSRGGQPRCWATRTPAKSSRVILAAARRFVRSRTGSRRRPAWA